MRGTRVRAMPAPGGPGSGAAAGGVPAVRGALPGGGVVVATGIDYLPGRLASQISAVLARLGPGKTAAGAAPLGRHVAAFGGMRNLPACVMRVTGGGKPRLVDLARYRGRPAAVIVAPAGGVLHVWVVTRNCLGTTGGVLAQRTLPPGG